MADKAVSESDIEAMTAEPCVGMFCNYEGMQHSEPVVAVLHFCGWV